MDLAYGYCNARVKGMETRLLSEQVMRELCQVKSLAEVVEILEETSYKESFVQASTRFTGIDLVINGLQLDSLATLAKLRDSLPKKACPLFNAITVEWEVQDLKQIVTKKALNEKVALEELTLYQVGGSTFIEKAANAESLDKTLDVIQDKYALSTAVKAFKEKNEFRIILDALDKEYYKQLAFLTATLPKNEKARGLLQYKLFLENAMIILRMKHSGTTQKQAIRQQLIPTAEKNPTLEKMVEAETVAQALALLDEAKHLQMRKLWEEEKKLWAVELALNKHFFEKAKKVLHLEVLSFGVVIGFLFLKTIETNNIKKIALGKHYGIEQLMQKHLIR